MQIGIFNIGDELLAGKILNTNAFDIAVRLNPLGHDIRYTCVLPDNEEDIVNELRRTLSTLPTPDVLDMLLITGGLGPTRDDVTRQAVARYLGRELEESEEAKVWLSGYLKKPIESLSPGSLIQTRIPSGCIPLRNETGTACGFSFRLGSCTTFVLPGVPAELHSMLTAHVLPALDADSELLERHVWTWGWSESEQRQALSGLEIPDAWRFSSLPTEQGVLISLSASISRKKKSSTEVRLTALWKQILDAIPAINIIDPAGDRLNFTVVKILTRLGATVSLAESCTGGGLGFLLTEVPGSSRVFQRGLITYSNEAKMEGLEVRADTLSRHGAVSEEVVREMLLGCLRKTHTEFACAITGIAGPEGGSAEKPVGLVWIAAGSRDSLLVKKLQLKGDRNAIRWRSCYETLNLLRLALAR